MNTTSPTSPAPQSSTIRRRVLIWMPLFITLLVPLSIMAHDLRVTLGAGCVALSVQAIVARIAGASRVVQYALAAGAVGFAAALWIFSSGLKS